MIEIKEIQNFKIHRRGRNLLKNKSVEKNLNSPSYGNNIKCSARSLSIKQEIKSRKTKINSKDKIVTNFLEKSKKVNIYEKNSNNKSGKDQLKSVDSIIRRKKE